jgi:hypothetical protein
MALLKAILDKGDDYGWGDLDENDEDEQQCFSSLSAAMEKIYSRPILQAAVKEAEKGRFYFRGNRFLAYLKKEWAKA